MTYSLLILAFAILQLVVGAATTEDQITITALSVEISQEV